MTQIIHCPNCIHYTGGLTCKAFPDGIPDEILEGMPHTEPYAGDNGITFKIDPKNEYAPYFVGKFGKEVLEGSKIPI